MSNYELLTTVEEAVDQLFQENQALIAELFPDMAELEDNTITLDE